MFSNLQSLRSSFFSNKTGEIQQIARLCAVGLLFAVASDTVVADDFSSYVDSGRRIAMPAIGDGSFSTAGAVLPDGRLIAVTGNGVYVESALGSGSFDLLAEFDAARTGGAVDPSFVTVSPGGHVAVGTGFAKPVAVFDMDDLGTPGSPVVLQAGVLADYFSVPHFSGSWYDENSLALTAGDFGQPAFVSLLDVTSDTANPANPVIVENIGGSSAGITFDAAGRLYTGNGFTGSGPSETGYIMALEADQWQQGLSGSPADFENEGLFIADLLSAGSLGFDAEGNLFVGGGDFMGDFGYFALINNYDLADVLAGTGTIDINDPQQVRRFDPEGSGSTGSYFTTYNFITGELYGGWAGGFSPGDPVTWAAYTVPAPGAGGLLAGVLILFSRRRHVQ